MGDIHFGTLFLLFFLVEITISYPYHHHDMVHTMLDNPFIKYTYSRFPEIEKHCGFLISSASELPPEDNRGERMKKELSFMQGDWVQESGGAPLMPINSHDMSSSRTYGNVPSLKIVSFWLMDVDPIRRATNTLSISGAMDIGLFRADTFAHKPSNWQPDFFVQQGTAKLTILFEGVYLESQENGGQGLMCLLGNATIPTSITQQIEYPCDRGNPWNPCLLNVNSYPSFLQDDQIMLVLRYPKSFTLRSRGISGEMKSLNDKRNQTFFDKIHISSQLGHKNSKYQFGSEELLSNACSPYPHPDSLANENIEMYKGDGYCTKLKEFVWNEVFEFVSPWKNIVKENDHSKIGPFSIDREAQATYGSSDKLRLMIQELQCEPGIDQEGGKTAMVSAVLRVIQKSEFLYRETMRTGLSTMTLSAEGRWDSSRGQLCMIGCLGPPSALSHGCKSRITLYLPLTFNIKQRSPVLGIISSIYVSESHPPLMFQRLTNPEGFIHTDQCYRNLNWSYTYSKIIQAREFQRRSKPSNFGINWRKTLFQYPASKGDNIASLSSLAELSVEHCAIPETLTDNRTSVARVELVLLSMGSFFGRYRSRSYEEKLELDKAFASSSRSYKEIEISGHLSITGSQAYNISLSFEGLYDPAVGQMYLIGCRDVEEFQDCLIEIKVEYSPENINWLLIPKTKFSIYSKRSKEDPFYIHPVSINTFLLPNRKIYDRATVMFRKVFEDGLHLLLLATAILCIRGQFCYSESQGQSMAYISSVMLGLHILDFSIPLITGDEVFLQWNEFASVKKDTSQFQRLQLFQALHYCINILLLFAFLETRYLLKRVLNSRQVENSNRVKKLLNLSIPSDKLVFLIFLIVHIIGFSIFYILRKTYEFPSLFVSDNYAFDSVNDKRQHKWRSELGNYGGIVQDLFLLPQIIGNALWGVQGKPLRKLYYIGYTMIRLVIRAYDYARDPLSYPGSENEFQYLRVESYFKLGNLIISAILVTLAVIVYIQQENGNSKFMPGRKLKECVNLDFKPESSYESLLSE